jgi:cytochrome c oxidase assembly factor CtaG
MNALFEAFVRSWPYAPWLAVALGVVAGIYLRGWLSFYAQSKDHWHIGQLVAFLGGLLTIYLALASPIELFASLLFQVHMLQHVLLMMAAPALLWLGEPLVPMLRGVGRSIREFWLTPLVNSPLLREAFGWLTHPVVALPIFVAATWLWHAPPLYQLALSSSGWHYVQHACFLGSGLLFWYPVIRPYPSHPRWSSWLVVPYLILADVQNTALSALLTFSSHVLYPYYLSVPRFGGVTALADQSAAGVLMWVPGSLAFLFPLFAIGIRLLSGEELGATRRTPLAVRRKLGFTPIPLPLAPHSAAPRTQSPRNRFDLLRVPVDGSFLKWRHARLALQLPMALLAALLILDGLRGPQAGPMNLAGVLPWIHWRGLLILSLLAGGNFFCLACPFTLPRAVARRWLPAGRDWPRWLRSKWLAVALLVLFLWAYEAFSLWDSRGMVKRFGGIFLQPIVEIVVCGTSGLGHSRATRMSELLCPNSETER